MEQNEDPSPPRKVRIALLGSGTGSNFEAIADAVDRGEIPGRLCVVISDVAEAPILKKAAARGLSSVWIDPGHHPPRFPDSAQRGLLHNLRAAGAELVVLAGFMRVVKAPVLTEYEGRIVNIHPSLLPKYPGIRSCERALEAGDTETGCTVHLVSAEVDAGQVLGQAAVPILAEDTAETLIQRIHQAEHRLYPAVIARLCREILETESETGSDTNLGEGRDV